MDIDPIIDDPSVVIDPEGAGSMLALLRQSGDVTYITQEGYDLFAGALIDIQILLIILVIGAGFIIGIELWRFIK